MEETVDMYIKETQIMFEAYREHLVRLEKQRKAAYDSLASLDVVCSFWSEPEDKSALVKVRENISAYIDNILKDIKSIDSIYSEVLDRKKSIKSVMNRLLSLLRELEPTESTKDVEDDEEDPVGIIAKSLFQLHPDPSYYNLIHPLSQTLPPPYQCQQSSLRGHEKQMASHHLHDSQKESLEGEDSVSKAFLHQEEHQL